MMLYSEQDGTEIDKQTSNTIVASQSAKLSAKRAKKNNNCLFLL